MRLIDDRHLITRITMKYLIDVYAIIILNTLIMQSQNESQNDVKS